MVFYVLAEGSLEVKLPTIWTYEKQRWEDWEKRREEERRSEKKKENPGARKGRRVAKHCVFPMICGSTGSKSRLATAAGAEPSGQMRDEKLHAIVTRSTYPGQNVQNTPGSDHFWKLRCGTSARRCGAKHVSKSKCTKHTMFGPLLVVEMSKAHFEVKMYKARHVRTTFGSWDVEKGTPLWREDARSTFASQNVQNTPFSDHFCVDVEKVHTVVARSTFASQKWKKLRGTEHLWTFRCRFAWQARGLVHLVKSEQNVRDL